MPKSSGMPALAVGQESGVLTITWQGTQQASSGTLIFEDRATRTEISVPADVQCGPDGGVIRCAIQDALERLKPGRWRIHFRFDGIAASYNFKPVPPLLEKSVWVDAGIFSYRIYRSRKERLSLQFEKRLAARVLAARFVPGFLLLRARITCPGVVLEGQRAILRLRGRETGHILIADPAAVGPHGHVDVAAPIADLPTDLFDAHMRLEDRETWVRVRLRMESPAQAAFLVETRENDVRNTRTLAWEEEYLALQLWNTPFHPEVRYVEIAGKKILITISLSPEADFSRLGAALLNRDNGQRIGLALRQDGALLVVELDTAAIGEMGLWDIMLVRDLAAVQLRAFCDDNAPKKKKVTFPVVVGVTGGAMASFEVYYRDDELLALRVRPLLRTIKTQRVAFGRNVELIAQVATNAVFIDQFFRSGDARLEAHFGLKPPITLPAHCQVTRTGFFAATLRIVAALPASVGAEVRHRAGNGQLWLRVPGADGALPMEIAREQIAVKKSWFGRLFSSALPTDKGITLYRLLNRWLPISRSKILYESFHGKGFSDNPRAIFEELRGRENRLKQVWVMKDAYQAVPGAHVVRPGSLAYYWHLASARVFVNNANFPNFFAKRDGTFHLETWHGTPLKRIGRDVSKSSGMRQMNAGPAVMARFARWDMLVSASPYTSEIFARAFDFRGEMLETGYPRNDVLALPEPRARMAEALRRELGIPDNKKIILYSPTWRDWRRSAAAPLSIAALRAALGESHVLLVRSHHESSTALEGRYLSDGFAADVTNYPDMRNLLSAADILVTDYSSSLFDYALTGRPMVFFAYDLAEYASRETRGFYFDFEREAPGPVVRTQQELVERLTQVLHWQADFEERRRAFVARYCTWDKGSASAQIAERILEKLRKPDCRPPTETGK